jgi:preprotein translocase subunit SecB
MSLVDFRLRRLTADLLQIFPELELDIWPEVKPVMTRLDEYVVYDVTYNLIAQDAKGRKTVETSATFTLVFLPKGKFSDEDFVAFGSIGALSIAHPYVRELFHSITSKMGLPPLLLEVMPPEPSNA